MIVLVKQSWVALRWWTRCAWFLRLSPPGLSAAREVVWYLVHGAALWVVTVVFMGRFWGIGFDRERDWAVNDCSYSVDHEFVEALPRSLHSAAGAQKKRASGKKPAAPAEMTERWVGAHFR
jgi:hypothetical protein